MTQATIQMTPGDDTHLTLLMAPQSLNFVTGQDREHLLAFGRAAFAAGQASKCLFQIAEPATAGTAVRAFRDYLGVHDGIKLGGQAMDDMALDLARIAPDFKHLVEPQHPDDAAVDALAVLMKAKLAKQREKGYGGWDTDCTQQRLSDMLRAHVEKGDPVDVANFCAFLLARGEGIAAAPQAVQPAVPVEVVTDLKNALADATEIRQQLRLMEEHARGDVWRWQADAANELATMGNRMGVLILASDLRNLLAAPAHPAEGVQAPMEGPGILFHCERATQPAAQGLDAQDAECLEIGRELCRACAELPWGYEIILYLEQGAGTVHWMDTDGNEHDIGEDVVFSEKIGYAIAAAQAKQGGC